MLFPTLHSLIMQASYTWLRGPLYTSLLNELQVYSLGERKLLAYVSNHVPAIFDLITQ